MRFHEVFQQKHLLLPKHPCDSKGFRTYLKKILLDYLDLIESISPKNIKLKGSVITNNLELSSTRQKEFIEGLLLTLEHYYEGKPFLAYKIFEKTMENRMLKYKKMLNIRKYPIGQNFYRIRKKEDNTIFSSSEMFHIPFELRNKVSTQRYSIPGFPSLYLGTSMYVSWEELNRPKLDEFQAIRLESKKEIEYLDLSNTGYKEGENDLESYRYLMTWPLIASCSIQVNDYSDNFKPEYIIPQFLLQWARDNKEIDGIRYSSTHIETNSLKGHSGLSNLVLPVKENKDKGFCNELTSIFNTTETISWQLIEFAKGGQEYSYFIEEQKELDNRVPELEIIKGVTSNYSATSFGKLERFLNYLNVKEIK